MREYDLKYRSLCIFGNNAETFAEADLQSPANFLAAESAVSWRNPWTAGRLLFLLSAIGFIYGYANNAA